MSLAPKTVKHRQPAWPTCVSVLCGEAFVSVERCFRGTRHGPYLLVVACSISCQRRTNPVLLLAGSLEAGHTYRKEQSEEPRGRLLLALTTVLRLHCVRCADQSIAPRHVTCTTHKVRIQGAHPTCERSRQPGTPGTSLHPLDLGRTVSLVFAWILDSSMRNTHAHTHTSPRPLTLPQTAQSALPGLQPTRFLHVPAHT